MGPIALWSPYKENGVKRLCRPFQRKALQNSPIQELTKVVGPVDFPAFIAKFCQRHSTPVTLCVVKFVVSAGLRDVCLHAGLFELRQKINRQRLASVEM